MENNDQVQLILQSFPLHEEVAQTTIAHLGLRSGFSLKEIEHLRSVMEATTKMFLAIRTWEKPLHVNFQISQKKMQVTVTSQTTKSLDSIGDYLGEFETFMLPKVENLVVNSEKSWVVFEVVAAS